ncbi:Hypothetical protein NTJ_05529 [Nesidiocoris tenuis]|uniref:Uncharacterized protein n=1 Tax=Nesidiocoris tenuis TaxID=355587 RepID=A0ABN7AKF2_9HEMI|nr:Hypothetical protein NTJ_05529 [Nesidiocoris tenuis]
MSPLSAPIARRLTAMRVLVAVNLNDTPSAPALDPLTALRLLSLYLRNSSILLVLFRSSPQFYCGKRLQMTIRGIV